jgi:CubicO group peptidase (beta-lactamase class C family)
MTFTSLLALAPLILPAQSALAPREDLAELLEPIRVQHGVPALGALVLSGGEVVALGAAGVRAQGEEEPATARDLWHLGSCTKAMTATLAGRLVEREVLGWDTTVGEVFGELVPELDHGWRAVTIEALLSHRGGAPGDLSEGDLWARLTRREGTPREQRRQLAEGVLARPPVHPPDGEFRYSNAGYAIAGAMLEELEDTPFEELMRRELFEPLGMQSAGFGPPGTAAALDQPRGHERRGEELIPVAPGPAADNPPAIGPAGTVHATLEDWARFVAAHVAGARGEDGVVTAETFARLHALPEGEEYTLGWLRPERGWAGGRVLHHGGSNTMWYCVVWAAPERDGAVLVTCNAGGGSAAQACDDVAAALVGRLGR